MLDAVCFKRHTAQRGQAESLDSHDGLKPSPLAVRVFKRQHQPACEAYCAFSPCHEKQNCLHTFSARCRPPGLQKRRGSEAGRNALDSKSSYGLIARTWVRIPPSPPLNMNHLEWLAYPDGGGFWSEWIHHADTNWSLRRVAFPALPAAPSCAITFHSRPTGPHYWGGV